MSVIDTASLAGLLLWALVFTIFGCAGIIIWGMTLEEHYGPLTLWQKIKIRNDVWTYPIRRWWFDRHMRKAFKLKPEVALWAFVRVYGADGQAPDDTYTQKYHFWEAKYPGRKGLGSYVKV